jgi:hypothetical protein
MSLTKALLEGAKPKIGSDKRISAGQVRDTASAASYTGLEITLSTTQLEGPNCYSGDTRDRLEIGGYACVRLGVKTALVD